MDRTLINQELEKFGLMPEEYISFLAHMLENEPPQDIAKADFLTVRFNRDRIEENIDSGKEAVSQDPEAHSYYLEITEKGDFLEMIKEKVLGISYARFLI